MMEDITLNKLREAVWDYYAHHGRHDLSWRQPEADGTFDPYKILVSELMLQQTQVARVIPKYRSFLDTFPSVQALADAELGAVLRAWSGLGYNRRAKYLKLSADMILHDLGGEFPATHEELTKLPGVGKNTAGAILAYARNVPSVFVETNIRTVFIHHYFSDETEVSDAAILEKVRASVDRENPREWYWALMDYGSFLKGLGVKLNKLSKEYTRQSTFHGSKRQVRGLVLKSLLTGPLPYTVLLKKIDDERLPGVLADLEAEGLVRRQGEKYSL